MAGATAVPLCTAHPPKELAYYVADSNAVCILAAADDPKLYGLCKSVVDDFRPGTPLGRVNVSSSGSGGSGSGSSSSGGGSGSSSVGLSQSGSLAQRLALPLPNDEESESLIIYTSGTTGLPKGALHTHSSLRHQMTSLCEVKRCSP